VTFRDFSNGLADFGVQIEESDVKTLFKYLDKNGSGKVDLGELLDELRGQEISFVRFDSIRNAYSKLDLKHNNGVTLDDIAQKYNVSQNPDVTSGKLTTEQAYK